MAADYKTTLSSNKDPVDYYCMSCFSSFGIQKELTPYRCEGKKCNRQLCGECIEHIKIYNGNNRVYTCMYCLMSYPENEFPKKNEEIYKKLLKESKVKYDIDRLERLLSTKCSSAELLVDMKRRRAHLLNLLESVDKFSCDASESDLVKAGKELGDTLLEMIKILEKERIIVETMKTVYHLLISKSTEPTNMGIFYIELCEDLHHEIYKAEQRYLFPKTSAILEKWFKTQGTSNEFQPKLLELLRPFEEDLKCQMENFVQAPSVRIGVIGYTSCGKSTFVYRLLGQSSLSEDAKALVSENKSTYFPLRFHRNEPLIDQDTGRKTMVTLIDIQGLDKNRLSNNIEMQAGNYMDEIKKTDCDIYILVFDETLSEEQRKQIDEIENNLKAKCVLVRSKVDNEFLTKFVTYAGDTYLSVDETKRIELKPKIIDEIRRDVDLESRKVYLVACNYFSNNSDAKQLLKNTTFDFDRLVNDLGNLAAKIHTRRIHKNAMQVFIRAINTCFRRGYVLNILKYKIAAGVAAIIPVLDQLPRYAARNDIRKAFGTDALVEYLKPFELLIEDYKLQTSVFEKSVKVTSSQLKSAVTGKTIVNVAGTVGVVAANFTDDIVRISATSLSVAARSAVMGATLGAGIVIAIGVCIWASISSGNHIFSYVNRICNDLIIIMNSFIIKAIDTSQESRTHEAIPLRQEPDCS